MNEEIEYAEMLEIPVSTVNVVKKKRKSKTPKKDVQKSLIDQVNEKINARAFDKGDESSAQEQTEKAEGVQTVAIANENYRFDFSEPETEDAVKTFVKPKKSKSAAFLTAEFALACALCGGIFLTNVFVSDSAINTFFRSLAPKTEAVDDREFSEFTLASVVGGHTSAEISVSETGVLSFTAKGCVYPVADGEVSEIIQNADGSIDLRVNYSKDFYGVLSGLNESYYAVGDEVKGNVPVGYSTGETEVKVMLFSDGELLNCFTLDEENRPVWTKDETAQP
ncbi:MAG: hypothetical protein IIX01_06420 [Clostridia bacterium]|nr:hypothetical protein [Clostridia bacterium]